MMPSSHPDFVLEFTPKGYKDEDVVSFRDGLAVSRKHSIQLTIRRCRLTWPVTVTLHALWPNGIKKLQRREKVRSICRHIQFDRVQLLRDTVTEVVISSEHDIASTRLLPLRDVPNLDGNKIQLCGRWFYTREDPFRIRFPPYNPDCETRAIKLAILEEGRELAAGVHEVRLADNERLYVYKQVDRPLYEPRDTHILEEELRNLELLHGAKFVVQLVGIVVSPNPYQTSRDSTGNSCDVVRGLLLEHHPNGTLACALRQAPNKADQPWQRWALQIASGLRELHSHGIAHMDLKPCNIVISEQGDAVLIDVSGRAITQEWLSPEMRSLFSPCSQSIEAKMQNDVWAYGRVVREMASVSCNSEEKRVLKRVASRTEVPPRIALDEAIYILQF